MDEEPKYTPELSDIERRFILALRANGYTLAPFTLEGHPVVRLVHTGPSEPGKSYIGAHIPEPDDK